MCQRKSHPPFCRAVEFGQRHPGYLDKLLKAPGLYQRIHTGAGVDNQQGLDGYPGIKLVDGAVNFFQFLHQVVLVVQAPGGIGDDDIRSPGDGCLQGIV